MEISPNKNKRTYISNDIIIALQDSTIESLNIYNQAFLELETPLINTSLVRGKTSYEIPVTFNLGGDLKGVILCFIDTYNKSIKPNDIHFFQSLFTESMNLLLGQILTNLDKNFDISSFISSPYIPNDMVILKLLSKDFQSQKMSMSYKLISNASEYNCRIILNIQRSNITMRFK